jgi:FkbM family methyltransferase
MYKRQSFKDKPIRTIYYLTLIVFFIIFKIKRIYKINIKGKFFFYTYKPYAQMGMGGRGQFVLREFYDPFLAYGLDILPKKFNFIDVGCSRGFFTLYLLATNSSDAKGICIDPFDYALEDLSEVLKLNKFENIQIIKGVVSDKTSDKIFLHNIDLPSEASLIKKKSHKNNKGFYCKSYTIDQLIYSMNLIKSIEFIKIDTESAELDILRGSVKTLKQMKPIIYLEITKNGKEIKELLLKNHYKLFHFINGKLEVVDGELPHTSILAKPLT